MGTAQISWLARISGSRRAFLLLAADIFALCGAVLLAFLARVLTGGFVEISLHGPLLFFLLVAPCVNYFKGLYDVPPPPLPDELRSLGLSTSLAWLCIAIFLIMSRVEQPSRLIFAGAWFLSLGLVPLARWGIRCLFSSKAWWGVPAVLFAHGKIPDRLLLYLKENREMGLNPAARVFFRDTNLPEQLAEDDPATLLPLLNSREAVLAFAEKNSNACAIVLISARQSLLEEEVEIANRLFSSVLLVPESFGDIPFAVRPVEIGQIFCLKVRQNLLDARRLFLKRTLDLLLSIVGTACILPLLLLIALCIRLESPGAALFHQERIGREGRIIRILKFRTMVANAEEVLAQYLAENPDMLHEWQMNQKLRNDPRITKIGAFLRRTSLDEIPQLWNVICGEMSLVGPRPIVEAEIPRYGQAFSTYTRVRPGITGLWQVSGRNDISYASRVRIDRFYINNWSIWLDLLILAKTLPVVIGRKGAY